MSMSHSSRSQQLRGTNSRPTYPQTPAAPGNFVDILARELRELPEGNQCDAGDRAEVAGDMPVDDLYDIGATTAQHHRQTSNGSGLPPSESSSDGMSCNGEGAFISEQAQQLLDHFTQLGLAMGSRSITPLEEPSMTIGLKAA